MIQEKMMMTTYGNTERVKVGDVLRGKKTGHLYDVVDILPTNWAGHGIYSLVCRETKEPRNIADFALYKKFEVVE